MTRPQAIEQLAALCRVDGARPPLDIFKGSSDSPWSLENPTRRRLRGKCIWLNLRRKLVVPSPRGHDGDHPWPARNRAARQEVSGEQSFICICSRSPAPA